MNKKQYGILKNCSIDKDMTEWNLYRLNHNNEKIDLKFTSLNNFYLLEANLSKINLEYTDLTSAKMSGAHVGKTKIISGLKLIILNVIALLLITVVIKYINFSLIEVSLSQIVDNTNYMNYINIFALSIIFWGVSVLAIQNTIESNGNISFLIGNLIGIGLIMYPIIYWVIYFLFSENSAWNILVTLSISFIIGYSYNYYSGQQKAIAYAENPEEVINFNSKFLPEKKETERIKDELSGLKSQLSEQERIKNELKENTLLSDEDKQRFQERLDSLDEKSKKRIEETKLLENRLAIIEKQEEEEKLIQTSMDEIKASFLHIEKTEKSLKLLNIVYGVLLLIGMVMLVYFGFSSYIHREVYFEKLTEISLSGSLGIVIFYATPILFAFSIMIFAISNIKDNIKAKEILLEKKYFIDLIESTFYAQIKIGGNARESLQKLIDKLSGSAFDQLTIEKVKDTSLNKEKKNNINSYLSQKRMDMLIQSLIKKV